MHNYANFVPFLEKSLAPFLRKVAKTSFLGHFGLISGTYLQNLGNNVKYQKSAWIGFLALHVPYFIPSFRKIVGAVSKKLFRTDGRTDGRTDADRPERPYGTLC